MYTIWIDPLIVVLDNLEPDRRESIISQLEEWSQRVQFDRRTGGLRGYSIAPLKDPEYRGIECLVDHQYRVIMALQFLAKPF